MSLCHLRHDMCATGKPFINNKLKGRNRSAMAGENTAAGCNFMAQRVLDMLWRPWLEATSN
jgi:hypothetical protein